MSFKRILIYHTMMFSFTMSALKHASFPYHRRKKLSDVTILQILYRFTSFSINTH